MIWTPAGIEAPLTPIVGTNYTNAVTTPGAFEDFLVEK
jgi:hypothetical protein